MLKTLMFKATGIALLAFFISYPSVSQAQTGISGYVNSADNGQPLIGAAVTAICNGNRATTNSYGYFGLSVPTGVLCGFKIEASGFETDTLYLQLLKDTLITFTLSPTAKNIGAASINVSGKLADIKSTKISQISLNPQDIKNIPTLGGELDILKVVQLLPGVQKGVEGQTGFQVRGGDADQNLILLDEATVYNVSHLFGFFSVFIPEALQDVQIYKGGFPSEYGGRLSSILDIRMKDGNNKKFSGSGGIGILSSRITLEGPIVKDKLSFIVSARRTYIDRVLNAVGLSLPYYFYDVNAKLAWELNKRNKFFYSFYLGNDILSESSSQQTDSNDVLNVRFGFKLGNVTNTLRWNHVYNQKWFSNVSLIYTQFRYSVEGSFNENSIYIGSKIYDIGVKADATYYMNRNNNLRMGAHYIKHRFEPNLISAKGDIRAYLTQNPGTPINNDEMAGFIRNEQQLHKKVKANYGVRISGTAAERVFYAAIEPRLALSWDVNKWGALKFGYARMKQYLHLVSSSSVALPTDLWYPVTKNVKPQRSDQFTLGYQHLFPKSNLTFTAEAYYKTMHNLTEYREGAVLLLNNNYENELLQGKGRAYGLEFMLRKEKGRLNGWISYTLGFSDRIFDSLNGGYRFPSKYDRRHNLAVVGNYRINKRWDFAMVWVYMSGARFTPQVGQYFMPRPGLNGVEVIPVFTRRNEVRMSPSHRLDINFVWKSKSTRKFRHEWHFSVYNFYNRAEPYRVRVQVDDETLGLKYDQPGLFGTLGSIAFNFFF